MEDLAKIVGYLTERQRILADIVIHLGCRADLYDAFVADCLDKLRELRVPDLNK